MINQKKAGVVLHLISLVINISISLIYIPIMIRHLGKSEYGVYALIISLIGLMNILDLGFGNAVVRYTTKFITIGDKEKEYRLITMFFILYFCISVLVIFIGTVIYLQLPQIFANSMNVFEIERAKILFAIMVASLVITFPLSVFTFVMIAYERFVFTRIIGIIRYIIFPCIMIPLLYMGYKSVAIAIVLSILSIIKMLINMAYCFRKLKIKLIFNNFDYKLLKSILSFSFWVFLNIITARIYWSTDQVILGIFMGAETVAVYAIASQISSYYNLFGLAINSVFLPKITTMVTAESSPKELSEIFIRMGRLQFIWLTYIYIGFILFGKYFIKWWVGPEYDIAYYIIIILMFPLIITLIKFIGPNILLAKNMNKFRSILYLVLALMNVVLTIPLAQLWGGIGCAIATAIVMVIGNGFIIDIYYYKVIKINIILFWKNIIRLSIPTGISFIIGILLKTNIEIDSPTLFVTNVILFSVGHGLIMWFFGLNKYEKNLIISLLLVPLKKKRRIKHDSLF